MLDSERTFKIKLRSRGTVFKILLTSANICIKGVLYEKEIVQYLQIYKPHEVDQGHSKKFLWKSLQQLVYFLGAVEFWPIFDIRISITLATFWQKLNNCTF